MVTLRSFPDLPLRGPPAYRRGSPKEVERIVRAYELMTIFRPELPETDVRSEVANIEKALSDRGAEITGSDFWGKRRFAYEIDHKTEGFYVVLEILAEGGALDELERTLRLADDVVRHKLIRLPDHEATRRGLLGEAPAVAG